MTTAPLSRLCIHTITTKPLGAGGGGEGVSRRGGGGITVWRDALEPLGVKESAKRSWPSRD